MGTVGKALFGWGIEKGYENRGGKPGCSMGVRMLDGDNRLKISM